MIRRSWRRRGFIAGTAAAVFALFRFVDAVHLVPASPSVAAVLCVVTAGVAGLAVFVAARIPAGPQARRALRLPAVIAACLAAVVLLALHMMFVAPILFDGERVGSLIAFQPPCVEGSSVRCAAGESQEACLKGLGYEEDLIEACWGSGWIRAVEITLAFLSLLVSGGIGWVFGLSLNGVRPLYLFICYRHDDSGRVVDALRPRLAKHFGEDYVFRDREAIESGEVFPAKIEDELQRCNVFLPVIGKDWLGSTNSKGLRLKQADDWVRIEIEKALARNRLIVLPVLVNGAKLPPAEEMPEGLERLSDLHAFTIEGDPGPPDKAAFRKSVNELIRSIEGREGSES